MKKIEKRCNKSGGNLDSQWCGDDVFMEFFPKAATQLGVVLDITSVVDECFFGLFYEISNTTGGCFGNNPGRRADLFRKK